VRGLEAVTCFPPTAGESIVKEKTIKQIFNGSVLKKRIQCKIFIWWDAFLIIWKISSGNGYDIVDKKTFNPTILITFGCL
jgi:hypothetical protein